MGVGVGDPSLPSAAMFPFPVLPENGSRGVFRNACGHFGWFLHVGFGCRVFSELAWIVSSISGADSRLYIALVGPSKKVTARRFVPPQKERPN